MNTSFLDRYHEISYEFDETKYIVKRINHGVTIII